MKNFQEAEEAEPAKPVLLGQQIRKCLRGLREAAEDIV